MRTIFDETKLPQAPPFAADGLYLFDRGGEFRDGLADFDDGLAGDDAYMLWGDEMQEGTADLIEGLMVELLDAEDADEGLGGLFSGLASIGKFTGNIGKLGAGFGKLGGGIGRLAGTAGRTGRQFGGVARRAQGIFGQATRLTKRAQAAAGRFGRISRRARNLNRQINRLSRQFGGGMPDIPDDPQRPDDRPQQTMPLPEPYASMMRQLQQQQAQGLDEFDAMADMADAVAEADFSDAEMDEALPIVGGMAANAIAWPLRHHGMLLGRQTGRELVRATTRAARTLVHQNGGHGLRALPAVVRGVRRSALRRGAAARALAPMVHRLANHVVTDPELARRVLRRLERPPAAFGRGTIEITILD